MEEKGTYDSDDGGIKMDVAETTEFGGFSDEEFGIGESKLLGNF